jgi:hypothetical protein
MEGTGHTGQFLTFCSSFSQTLGKLFAAYCSEFVKVTDDHQLIASS